MGRVKVPMYHSFKKNYYVVLRESLFAWNPGTHAKVKNYLIQKEEISESEIEMHLHCNVTCWSDRAHISTLPPSTLCLRVKAIFSL